VLVRRGVDGTVPDNGRFPYTAVAADGNRSRAVGEDAAPALVRATRLASAPLTYSLYHQCFVTLWTSKQENRGAIMDVLTAGQAGAPVVEAPAGIVAA
jgi:hypothetical protein